MTFRKDFVSADLSYTRQLRTRVELSLALRTLLLAVALLAILSGFGIAHFLIQAV